jgi:hypothetical protein
MHSLLPKNGVYSVVNDIVEVEYGISPARKRGRKLLRRLNFGGTALGLGASLVGIAAFSFPGIASCCRLVKG